MKLHSFRELLIKKSSDPSIESLVTFIHDDVLADMVMESLEKMARAGHKGDAANFAIRDFGVEMDPEHEPKMVHDALSHHASRYKSALSEGRHDLANKHAKQIFRIVDLADQAQKHSHGKLHIDAVSPHAWERNAKQRKFTEEDAPVKRGNKKAGQFAIDTKGWRYRGNDYSFLQQAPHESFKGEVRKHGHAGAYPLEHIRVNGKYLDIADVPASELKGYQEHEFDKHPIMSHFEVPASQRTSDHDKQYVSERDAYSDSPHLDSYFKRHETLESTDPEKYKARGSKASDPVHKPVDPLDVGGEAGAAAPTKQKVAAPAQTQAAKEPEMSLEEKVESIKKIPNLPDNIKDMWIRQETEKHGKK
jgi:hypothetical protein